VLVPARCGCAGGIGEAGRLVKGEATGDTIRVRLDKAGSKLVSSPSSKPEINRFVRGRRVEEVAWAEFVRTLLELIANYAALQEVGCMWWRDSWKHRGLSSKGHHYNLRITVGRFASTLTQSRM
jgi:hypothetical protein